MTDQGTPTSENATEPTPSPEERTDERTFTQKDVDKIAGNRAKEAGKAAEKAAYTRLLEELGAESLDEIKEGYQGFKTVEAETQTEAEKARADAEKLKVERDEAKSATEAANKRADERLIKAELKLQLLAEGARKDRLEKMIRDADLSDVEIDGEEVKNLAPVVKTLKDDEYPEWFGSDEKPSGSKPSPQVSGPTTTQTDKEVEEASRARIAAAL